MAQDMHGMSLQINLISLGLFFLKSYFRFTLELTVNCHSSIHLFKFLEP